MVRGGKEGVSPDFLRYQGMNHRVFTEEYFIQDIRQFDQGLTWVHKSFSLSLRGLSN